MSDAEFKRVEAALHSALGRETCYVACFNAANERLSGTPVTTLVQLMRDGLQIDEATVNDENW